MTVDDLQYLLSFLPGNTPIKLAGPDCGGYDWELCDRAFLIEGPHGICLTGSDSAMDPESDRVIVEV